VQESAVAPVLPEDWFYIDSYNRPLCWWMNGVAQVTIYDVTVKSQTRRDAALNKFFNVFLAVSQSSLRVEPYTF
jgi:hypothetical protein